MLQYIHISNHVLHLKLPQCYTSIVSQETQGKKCTLCTDWLGIVTRSPHTTKKKICMGEGGKPEKDSAWDAREKSCGTIPSFQLLRPEIIGIILDTSIFLTLQIQFINETLFSLPSKYIQVCYGLNVCVPLKFLC